MIERACAAAVLLGCAPIATAQTVPGDPWAVGYSIEVARACPAWQVEKQEVLAERGVLPVVDAGSNLFAMGGAFQQIFHEGQAAAEADERRHTDFCDRVPAVAGDRWSRLARVLKSARS